VYLISRTGEVSLDSSVAEYAVGVTEAVREQLSGIRMHHLLCHTHGLEEARFNAVPRLESGRIDLAAVLRSACAEARIAPPGSLFSYSDTGYWIAAAIVEEVCGRSFADLLNHRLLQHLGIAAVTGSVCPAQGYGLHLSTGDLAAFLTLHTQPEAFDIPGLERQSLFSMYEMRIGLPGWRPCTEGIAMGWKNLFQGWIGHNGFSDECDVIVRANPQAKRGLIIAVWGDQRHNIIPLAARLYAGLLPEFRSTAKATKSPACDPEQIVGTYGNGSLTFSVTSTERGELKLAARRQGPAAVADVVIECELVKVREGLYRLPTELASRFSFLQFLSPAPELVAAHVWDGRRLWPRLVA